MLHLNILLISFDHLLFYKCQSVKINLFHLNVVCFDNHYIFIIDNFKLFNSRLNQIREEKKPKMLSYLNLIRFLFNYEK